MAQEGSSTIGGFLSRYAVRPGVAELGSVQTVPTFGWIRWILYEPLMSDNIFIVSDSVYELKISDPCSSDSALVCV